MKKKGMTETLKFIMMVIFALGVVALMIIYAVPKLLGGGLV